MALAVSARRSRDCIPRKRGKIKENASHFGGRQIAAPTGIMGKSARKTQSFLHRKTYIACLLTGKLPYRNKSVNNQRLLKTNPRILTKIRSRSYILRGTNKPYERAKPIHEIIICGICGTTKNPANGKHIRSQGSVYNNVKMTIRKSPSLRLTTSG